MGSIGGGFNRNNDHEESFQDWIDDGIVEAVTPDMWQAPWRNIAGHRITVSDAYKPIPTLKLNWRWWLAEIPNRILARWAIKQTNLRDQAGEVYVNTSRLSYGTDIHRRIEEQYRETGPE
jgi:hypothetical protein